MVGIVIVSHSQKLAEGVVELAKAMARDAKIVAAGGMDDGGIGTSFERISNAIDEVYSDEGTAIIMDMGSALMTTEMVIESMEDRKLRMIDCPVLEGAILAAVESATGASLEDTVNKAFAARDTKKLAD